MGRGSNEDDNGVGEEAHGKREVASMLSWRWEVKSYVAMRDGRYRRGAHKLARDCGLVAV